MALAQPLLLSEERAAEEARLLAEANDRLAVEAVVPEEIEALVGNLVSEMLVMADSEIAQMDPYLLLALQRGLLEAQAALQRHEEADKRRFLRVALEKVRQALRDLSETWPIADDRPAKDVARWLAETVAVPQATLAGLIGTTPRTFQRWISPIDPTRPQGAEERRLRVISRLVAHLRHALTGPGVIAWLQTPHAELDGLAPNQLLDDPNAVKRLLTLASRARSSNAA